MNIIEKYFPHLSEHQKTQFDALFDLYSEWNAKINVISRKDIENLYTHHVLHSLAIARYIQFVPQTKVLDIGTGGGFPGIPLAIFFPDVHFTLIDSIGKKIKVVEQVAKSIDLHNVDYRHSRVEEEKRKFEFVVSRAVMALPQLAKIVRKNIANEQKNGLPNGLICLKGGDVTAEVHPFGENVDVYPLSRYFDEPFFETKKIIYLSLS